MINHYTTDPPCLLSNIVFTYTATLYRVKAKTVCIGNLRFLSYHLTVVFQSTGTRLYVLVLKVLINLD